MFPSMSRGGGAGHVHLPPLGACEHSTLKHKAYAGIDRYDS